MSPKSAAIIGDKVPAAQEEIETSGKVSRGEISETHHHQRGLKKYFFLPKKSTFFAKKKYFFFAKKSTSL